MPSMRMVPKCLYIGTKIVRTGYLNNNNNYVNRYAVCNSRNLWHKTNKTLKEESKNTESETETEGSQSATAQKLSDADQSLKLEIAQLTKTVEDLKKYNELLDDKYKRALADGENLRIRLTKQIEEAKVFGIQGFCKDLLEVADVLAKATECVPKDQITDNNPHLKNLYEGLTMTETELKRVFTRHGLTPINPLTEKFNPNAHEALFQQEVDGAESGTVVVVSKIGYKLKERVIRPALVGVSK